MPDVKVNADSQSSSETTEVANPHLEIIYEDIENREKWASKDRVIQKRRLADRPKKKKKPYPGAPNFVVPIIDDCVREKTDQEISMMLNARMFGYFVPLDKRMSSENKGLAETGFDAYLRYVINIPPKLDEADDNKNARGFAIIKVTRNEYERFRFLRPELQPDEPVMLPDIEVRDPADVILPYYARRDMFKADRITDVYRYSIREFREIGKKNKAWKNVEKVIEEAGKDNTNDKVKGLLETTGHLIGLTTSGKNSKQVVLYEYFHYADDWTVEKAKELYKGEGGRAILKGRKCRMLFSPDAPKDVVAIYPWRERDREEYLSAAEWEQEKQKTRKDWRELEPVRIVQGADKDWPHIQCRYENRSALFYDSRGVGHLVMDDQIAASATRNTKHVLMDYYQWPQYQGPGGHRNSPQMTHEPGGFLPEGVTRVDPVDVPASLDFTTDQFKREAARRVGTVGQYEYSDQVSLTKKVQKTATEVSTEAMRGDVISSASVDRFINPWAEVFRQLWLDLKRLNVRLPMITNREFRGVVGPEMYQYQVLIVPAGNAKTLNPDMQFLRDRELWDTLVKGFASMGIVLNAQRAAEDMTSHVDPMKINWIGKPDQRGEGGQQPVYQALGELSMGIKQLQEMLQGVTGAVKATAKLAEENSKRLDSGFVPTSKIVGTAPGQGGVSRG